MGSFLGHCLLTEQIGRGASCQVFRALHVGLNITVAVKVLPRAKNAGDPALLEQLRVEACLLAQLNHPHIVRVLDFEDATANPFLVLEYVEGLNLAELIAQSGRLQRDRVLCLAHQLAEALQAALRLGVVHRDVKPANILLTRDGRAKLADLGLARVIPAKKASGGAETPRTSMVGTAAYMAPEQALAAPSVDHRADIYSLGATLYHALTGQLPFSGRTRMQVLFKHAQEPPLPPNELVPELGSDLSAVILKMLAKNPADRYQSYEKLLADVAALRDEPLGAAVPQSEVPTKPEILLATGT